MRVTRELHNSIFRQYSDHEFSEKLKKIDTILDLYPKVADWAMADLVPGLDPRGAAGITAEEVLRAGLLMQIENLTYNQLEFHLKDSMTI